MSKTVQQIWGLNTVNPYLLKDSPVRPNEQGEQVFGVELEIENTTGIRPTDAFMVKEDGSLRNSGMEYVSYPMAHRNLAAALQGFFERNPHLGEENYSERTSVHVHANVQDMTLPQIGNLVLLYQVFETLLFQFVGHDRAKNIFCVPLSECATSYRSAVDLQLDEHRVISRWSKYTAMNLLPVRDIGTVEFRHMHGTCDMLKLAAWLNLLATLMFTAKNYKFDEIYSRINDLNTSSQFKQFGGWVFGKHIAHLQGSNYDTLLENGVLDAKWACLGIEKLGKAAPREKVTFQPAPQVVNPVRVPDGRPAQRILDELFEWRNEMRGQAVEALRAAAAPQPIE